MGILKFKTSHLLGDEVMKVYLVDSDNGESYEDYAHDVVAVFKSFRSASQYLIDEGYKPNFSSGYGEEEDSVFFYWLSGDGYSSSHAEIVEMDLQE